MGAVYITQIVQAMVWSYGDYWQGKKPEVKP